MPPDRRKGYFALIEPDKPLEGAPIEETWDRERRMWRRKKDKLSHLPSLGRAKIDWTFQPLLQKETGKGIQKFFAAARLENLYKEKELVLRSGRDIRASGCRLED